MAPLPAAPVIVIGFVIGFDEGVVFVPIVGVGLEAGVVPVIPDGVVIEPVVGVFIAVLPAAPPLGGVVMVPVVVGVVGVVGVVWTGAAGGVVSLPHPLNAAMMQSVDSVESLVIMESSNFELTHISPKTALPLRNPPTRAPRAPNRVWRGVEPCDSGEVWT
jgi:hypothetical protein